jgi:hypothetical protein
MATPPPLPDALPPRRKLGCFAMFFIIVGILFTSVVALFIIGGALVSSNSTRSGASLSSTPDQQAELRKAQERDARIDRVISRYSSLPPVPSPTPDLSLLQVTKHTWEKGGFDTVALWHITFWNRSDKPIGNIRYRTRYTAETGDQVDRGGVDALLGDYTIRKVVPPHQKRTTDIKVKYWEITADTLSKAGSSVP